MVLASFDITPLKSVWSLWEHGPNRNTERPRKELTYRLDTVFLQLNPVMAHRSQKDLRCGPSPSVEA